MKKILKLAIRSGSLSFARSALSVKPTGDIRKVIYQGRPVYFREGTSDGLVVYEILFKGKRSEYWHSRLPKETEVGVVLDIGANIGAASVFFGNYYPRARICSFEPVPDNFSMLTRNTEISTQVERFQIALSDHDGELTMIHSPGVSNHGGWSFYQRGASGNEEKITVPIRRSGDFLREIGIETIDVIKIDTEGAEKEILKGLYPEQLATVKFMVGELHGERDFELLDWLEQKGFDIECKKSFNKPAFIFKAIRVKK